MKIIRHTEAATADIGSIGGKVWHLVRLEQAGLSVPGWMVIPAETLEAVLQGAQEPGEVRRRIMGHTFDETLIHKIKADFPGTSWFAVRSSAVEEDGAETSFAGQFESFLFVRAEDIPAKIREVWLSAFSGRVAAYRETNNLQAQPGIAVIIQEMIAADAAGVAFGIHPSDGNRKQKVISAVWGLGEGLVSGALDADVYTVAEDGGISRQIVLKQQRVVQDDRPEGGTRTESVPVELQQAAALDDEAILEVASVLDTVYRVFGTYQDVEFARKEGHLYVLQSRAVTVLHKLADSSDVYTLWDNSNIVESYPGVTTPLTFSFISRSYEGAYRLFCEFLGVDRQTLQDNDRVFKNTLGFMNGRVYYNLKTWYRMLALVPGYSINARSMEQMMGVKERFDLPGHTPLSRGKAWWRVTRMAVQMLYRYKRLPAERAAFQRLLDEVIGRYKRMDMSRLSAHQLMDLYLDFERQLLNEWKAPLLNDFFAMIWFGILQKQTAACIPGSPNIHNDLLCGSRDIISTQPIHRSIALTTMISNNPAWKKLFAEQDADAVWTKVSSDAEYIELRREIERYIDDFGERCIGELKLETVSYSQDPRLFIRVLKSYVHSGITVASIDTHAEQAIRERAENALGPALKGRFLKKWWIRKALSKTRELVSARENLRYERTRAFGIVRGLFSAMGQRWYAERILADPRDIFYLTREEIFAFIEGRSVTQDIRALAAHRKGESEAYKAMPVPAERFATYGIVYHANDFYSRLKVEVTTGDLKGTGCCPGIVRAPVKVVTDPASVSDMEGAILVTSSTDPGWVTLFPGASGIIVERGSLLSHSAIVSREMGKPCIVGVTGLLQRLHTGDVVEMDGSSGYIRIITSPEHTEGQAEP